MNVWKIFEKTRSELQIASSNDYNKLVLWVLFGIFILATGVTEAREMWNGKQNRNHVERFNNQYYNNRNYIGPKTNIGIIVVPHVYYYYPRWIRVCEPQQWMSTQYGLQPLAQHCWDELR